MGWRRWSKLILFFFIFFIFRQVRVRLTWILFSLSQPPALVPSLLHRSTWQWRPRLVTFLPLQLPRLPLLQIQLFRYHPPPLPPPLPPAPAIFALYSAQSMLHMAYIHQEQHSIRNMQVAGSFLNSCSLYSLVWGQKKSDFQTVFCVWKITDFWSFSSKEKLKKTILRVPFLPLKIAFFFVFWKW